MPIWIRYGLLLVIAVWCLWYFGKMLGVGLRSGDVMDSKPVDGKRITRVGNPISFWLSMTIAALMVVGTIYLIGLLSGHLLGYWEADL